MTAAWSLSQPGLAKACVHGECIRPSLTQTALKKSSTGTHLITSQELEGMRATHRVRRRGNPELNQELPRERGYCRLNLVELYQSQPADRASSKAGWTPRAQPPYRPQNPENGTFCASFGAKCKSQRLNGLSKYPAKSGLLCRRNPTFYCHFNEKGGNNLVK